MLRLEATDRATDPPGPPRSYLFDRGPVCVGRSLRQNHISLRGSRISRLHAVLDQTIEGWWILHRGRMTDTMLNGIALVAETPHKLRDNDVIEIERHQIVVRIDLEEAESPTDMMVAPDEVMASVRKIVEASRKMGPPPRPAAPPAGPADVRGAHASPAVPPRAPAPAETQRQKAPAPPAAPPAAPGPAAKPDGGAPKPAPTVRRLPSAEETGELPEADPGHRPLPSAEPTIPPVPPGGSQRRDRNDLTDDIFPEALKASVAAVAASRRPDHGTPPAPREPLQFEKPTVHSERPAAKPAERPAEPPAIHSERATAPAPRRTVPPPAAPPPPPSSARSAPSADESQDNVRRGVPAAAAPTGTVLAGPQPRRFEMKRRLRIGGIGVLMEAADRTTGGTAVIEEFPAALVAGPGGREAFSALAVVLRGISAPGIVRVLGGGMDGDVPYLQYELPAGRTLADEIQAAPGGSDATRVLGLADALADALSSLHAANVFHGNLHPGNVWMTDDGRPLLLGCGIASLATPRASQLPTADWGPLGCIAPEAGRRGAVDSRADQYALGAVVYAFLTGEAPGARSDPVAGRRPGVNPAVAAVVDRALSPSPDARFADMAAMRAAFHVLPRRASRVRPLAAILVVAVLGAAAAFATGVAQRTYRSVTRDAALCARAEAAAKSAHAAKDRWRVVVGTGGVGTPADVSLALSRLVEADAALADLCDAEALDACEACERELAAAAASGEALVAAQAEARKAVTAASGGHDDAAGRDAAARLEDADRLAKAGDLAAAVEAYKAATAAAEAATRGRAEAASNETAELRQKALRQLDSLQTTCASRQKAADDAAQQLARAEEKAKTLGGPLLQKAVTDLRTKKDAADQDLARVVALYTQSELAGTARRQLDLGTEAERNGRLEEARAAYESAIRAVRELVETYAKPR